MINKLGQGIAVGLTAISSAVVAGIGLVYTQNPEVCLVMVAPVVVAFLITIADGWD